MLSGRTRMADYVPVWSIEDARHCVEQAKCMLERARFLWSQANKTLEEAKLKRADLLAQIEDLARRGPLRPQFTATLLTGILDAVVEGTGADMGNIQLLDLKANQLFIHVQHGFDESFLKFFNSVHPGQAACGTALEQGQRVVVPDVANSAIFSDSHSLEILLDAGVRAVQSTPVIGKSGRTRGMLSTHYRNVNRPSKADLRLIDYYADWTAEILDTEFRAAHPNGIPVISRVARPTKSVGEEIAASLPCHD